MKPALGKGVYDLTMKSLHSNVFRTLIAAVLVAGSASFACAHYEHDDRGWYDSNHHRHAYTNYHGHRGYWDHNDSGARIFIRI